MAGPALRNASTMVSSDSVKSPAGSNSISVMSTSARLADAVWVMRASSLLRGLWMPGVSIRTYCTGPFVTIPIMRLRVVWGFWVTIATFSPTSRLVRLDLPTLGRPTRATNTLLVISGSFFFVGIGQPFLLRRSAEAENKQIGDDKGNYDGHRGPRADGNRRPKFLQTFRL